MGDEAAGRSHNTLSIDCSRGALALQSSHPPLLACRARREIRRRKIETTADGAGDGAQLVFVERVNGGTCTFRVRPLLRPVSAYAPQPAEVTVVGGTVRIRKRGSNTVCTRNNSDRGRSSSSLVLIVLSCFALAYPAGAVRLPFPL